MYEKPTCHRRHAGKETWLAKIGVTDCQMS